MTNRSLFRWVSFRSRKEERQTPDQIKDEIVQTAPESQTVLLLHAAKQSYQVTPDYAVPRLENENELLARVHVIGLNPIDWKAP